LIGKKKKKADFARAVGRTLRKFQAAETHGEVEWDVEK
jgi:hypothetical protein